MAPKKLPGTIWSVLDMPRDRPGIVPAASWERPERPQGRSRAPGRAPGSARERFGAIKIDAEAPPGPKKANFLRAPRLRTVYGAMIRRFLSIFGFFAKCKNAPMYCACQSKSRFDTSRCQAKRSRDATLKNTENRPKNRSESVENRVSGPLGRPFRIGISGISGISGVSGCLESSGISGSSGNSGISGISLLG